MKVLLLENIHPVAAEAFRRDGLRGRAALGLAVARTSWSTRCRACPCSGSAPTPRSPRGCSRRPRTCWRSAASASAPTRSTSTRAAERGVGGLQRAVLQHPQRRRAGASARSSRWPAGCPRRPSGCTTASGTSRPRAATRSAAARSASSATATSAPSCPTSPRRSACGWSSTTPPTGSPTATPAGCGSLDELLGAVRRRQPARRRPARATPGLFGAEQFAPMKPRLGVHQRLARHGRRRRRAARRTSCPGTSPAPRSTSSRSSRRRRATRSSRRCAASTTSSSPRTSAARPRRRRRRSGTSSPSKLLGFVADGRHRAVGQPARGRAAARRRARSGSGYLHHNVPGVLAGDQPDARRRRRQRHRPVPVDPRRARLRRHRHRRGAEPTPRSRPCGSRRRPSGCGPGAGDHDPVPGPCGPTARETARDGRADRRAAVRRAVVDAGRRARLAGRGGGGGHRRGRTWPPPRCRC